MLTRGYDIKALKQASKKGLVTPRSKKLKCKVISHLIYPVVWLTIGAPLEIHNQLPPLLAVLGFFSMIFHSRPFHSLMMSSHRFSVCLFVFHLELFPCSILLACPDDRLTCPYHFSLRLFTEVRRSSYGGLLTTCKVKLGHRHPPTVVTRNACMVVMHSTSREM